MSPPVAETELPDHSEPRWVEIVPGDRVVGSIRPPGSKSLTNRAVLCGALASGRSILTGALHSEDTEVMISALSQLGVTIDRHDGGRRLEIDGGTWRRAASTDEVAELFVANSGTTIRFLTAALSAAGGQYRLHGVPRMHERPIHDLVAAIERVIDGRITTESAGGCPPVKIESAGWCDRHLQVAGSVSSQYLSGLMMAAPIVDPRSGERVVAITVTGELVSRPYVEMTADVMRSFGANVELVTDNLAADQTLRVEVEAGRYEATQYSIEPDASAASYFWAAAAISGGTVTVEGLSADALQGDVQFCDVLRQMGCGIEYQSDAITVSGAALQGIDVDMNPISDTVQTLAVVALFAQGPTRVRGVAHNRFKETDRIGDLARELTKLGAQITEHGDGMTINPPSGPLRGASLETYHDHRMAMSLALAGLRVAGVRIANPACTSKTYPDYFADLERLTGRAHRWA